MTTYTLEQIKNTVPYTVSQKPWYKEYPFRIAFIGEFFNSDSLIRTKYRILHRAVRLTLASQNISYRKRDDYNFYIYLKSSSDVSAIVQLYAKDIIDVAGPYSENHKDAMLNDLTLLVKDHLFYKHYRYKVSFRLFRTDMDFFEEIAEFVTDNFEHGTYKLNSAITDYSKLKRTKSKKLGPVTGSPALASWYTLNSVLPYVSTGTVYLKNYEDLCTIHMMYKSKITNTVKITLNQEIE